MCLRRVAHLNLLLTELVCILIESCMLPPPPPPPSPFLLVTLPPSVTCVQACCLSQVAPHLVRGATPHLIHTPPAHTSFFLFHALVLYCGNCLGPGFCWVGQGGSRTLAHLDGVGNRGGGRGWERSLPIWPGVRGRKLKV